MQLGNEKDSAEQKQAFGLFCLHVACVLVLLAASLGGYTLFNGLVLRIPVFLILVFMAGLVNTRLCPAWLAFLSGMLLDFFGQGPLGLNAIAFVVVLMTVERRGALLRAQIFTKIWLHFCVSAVFVLGLSWLALSTLNGVLFSPVPTIAGTLILAVVFPVLFKPLYALALRLEPDADGRLV